MIYGFTFKDISLSSFDASMQSADRTLAPSVRKKQLVIPGMHGTWNFGNESYDNRPIDVQINIKAKSKPDLRKVLRQLAAWLSGEGKLTFDDEPDVYYIAKVNSEISCTQFASGGKVKVKFDCMPFALYQVSTGEDIILDSDLPLDSDILLNPVDAFTVNVTGGTTFNIDYWGTEEVGLGSPMGSKFDIVITGTFTKFSIALNGKTISYNEAISGQTVTINNVDATVKQGNINKLSICTGDLTNFLKLIPGVNTVTISGTGLNCSVLFDFRPQYI